MKGNKLCLCFLLAAGVGLGAHAQNKIAALMKDVNQDVNSTLDSLNVARSARPVSDVYKRQGGYRESPYSYRWSLEL